METKQGINVRTLDISARLRNVLTRNGVEDLSQIKQYTKEEILRFRNMGEGTYKELETLCETHNITIWSMKKLIETFRPYRFPLAVYHNMFLKNVASIQDFADMTINDIEEIAEMKKFIVRKICYILEQNHITIKE